ncbi:BMP family ABC transporter substrate-binding protein [Dapis sp. BLCC M126]|uniref:BMP family ABC transporter substrate-binding protein n=1 Tax=Dapis sp. BLCC M126 TaxID=3400189 RepID=UPI003CF25536
MPCQNFKIRCVCPGKYAKSEFNYIISHGAEFESAIKTVAAEFSRTKFALTSSSYSGNNHNLGVLNYKLHEAGYLSIVVAALVTKINKIGFIGSINYKIILAQANLLEKGTLGTKSNIDIDIKWLVQDDGNK